MGPYEALFGIFAEHHFFVGDVCRGLEFVPTDHCMNLMKRTGLIMRTEVNGIRVFCNGRGKDALLLHGGDPVDPANFSFKVYSRDRSFQNYTDLPTLSEDLILYLDDRRAKDDPSAEIVLNREEYISEKDSEPIDSEPINSELSKRDRLIRPILMVNICAEGDISRFFDEQANVIPKKYFLKFHSRATFWKYYVIGEIEREDLYITDLNREIEFEEPRETSLPGSRSALIFKSKTSIPLLEKSHFHFQLKERNSGNGRVLIRRLPVASATHIYKEAMKEGGDEVAISEIYINY